MGGKGSAPAAPDYVGATQLQGEISKENLNTQNFANRPTINTPWGTQSWQTQAVKDPATGQIVTGWTQNTSLAPGLQQAVEDQFQIQAGRSDLANQFMGRVANEYSNPFDYASLPPAAQAAQPNSLRTGTTDYTPGLQTGLGAGAPALPQFDSNYRDNIANTLMQRMVPVHERQLGQLETKLSNQGFTQGSEGYKRALDELNQRQAAERYNALDTAGNEAGRLFQMGMGSRQQAMSELGFGNQALGQAQGLDLARMQAGNQAMQQQYGLNQQYADSMNRLRQQAIAEQMQRRGMSLNEMNALLTGQQVGMPQMPSFNPSGQAQTPDLMGALSRGYDAQLNAYNAQQAAGANMMGGLFSLGSAAMGMPGAGKLFGL